MVHWKMFGHPIATWWFPCMCCKFSGFQQVDDWLTWLAMQQVWCWILRITTTTKRPSKAKVETFNITQRKGIHWTWYLAKTWTLCFCSIILFRSVVFFEIINEIPYHLQHRLWKPHGFWQISDGEVDEIPEVLELVRGVSWKTLRWVVGLMVEIKHPPPRENKVLYGGWFFGGLPPFSLWCTLGGYTLYPKVNNVNLKRNHLFQGNEPSSNFKPSIFRSHVCFMEGNGKSRCFGAGLSKNHFGKEILRIQTSMVYVPTFGWFLW